MKTVLEHSLAIWLGGSLLIHFALGLAFRNSDVPTSSVARTEHERIAVQIVMSRVATPTTPDVMAPPPAVSPPARLDPATLPIPSVEVEMTSVSTPRQLPPTPAVESPLVEHVPSGVSSAGPIEVDAESVTSQVEGTAAEDQDVVDPLPAYVAAVRARVDSNKRYPAMARRRSEEGLVLARLSISSDGRLEDVEVDRAGPMLLRRATREAVEAAAPFSMPPSGPVVVEIPIRWRVHR